MRLLKYIVILALLGVAGFFGYKYVDGQKIGSMDKEESLAPAPKKEKVSKESPKKEDLSKKSEEKKLPSKTSKSDKVEIDRRSFHYSKKPKVIPKDAVLVELPEVPKVEAKVPQVITVGSKVYERHEGHKRLSTTMPKPKEKIVKKEENKEENSANKKLMKSDVGEVKLGRVSTYIRADLIPKKELLKRLKDNGFEILTDMKLDKNGDLEVIVFSDENLKQLSSNSLFISNLRVLIDKKNKQLSISNPLYFSKAFLRDKFDEKTASTLLHKVSSAFGDLNPKDSGDKLKDSLISKYQFMFGMPYYDDMITVAKGSGTNLIKKAKNSKRVSFIQDLGNGKALIGMRLSSKTRDFIKATGEKNALLLPYPIIIEDNKAKILNPKYYIAVSYPMLKMSQFMKISDIPDAIEAEARAVFK